MVNPSVCFAASSLQREPFFETLCQSPLRKGRWHGVQSPWRWDRLFINPYQWLLCVRGVVVVRRLRDRSSSSIPQSRQMPSQLPSKGAFFGESCTPSPYVGLSHKKKRIDCSIRIFLFCLWAFRPHDFWVFISKYCNVYSRTFSFLCPKTLAFADLVFELSIEIVRFQSTFLNRISAIAVIAYCNYSLTVALQVFSNTENALSRS